MGESIGKDMGMQMAPVEDSKRSRDWEFVDGKLGLDWGPSRLR